MCFTQKKTESGFTLVELAIALMIIGLLIGGVLKGIELVENARVTQIVRGVKAYETATTAFQSIYTGLPGDLANPGTRLPGCTASPCDETGDNNGIIDDDGTLNTTGAAAADPADDDEERNFWLHLAVAGLISGVDSTGASTGVEWGKAYPASPVVGAGYMIQYVRMSGAPGYIASARFSGHYVNLRGTAAADGVLTGNQGLQLDTKFDDGNAASGDIFAVAGDVANTTCSNAGGVYVVNSDSKECSLYFKMSK